MKSPRSVLMGVVLILAGIGLTAVGASRLLQRNTYESIATVSIHRPSPINDNSYDPYFLLTEFETVQSHSVLTKVIAAFDLNDAWGKKYNQGQRMGDSKVEDMLKRKLELRLVRNTALMQIKVFDDDPMEAAKLANAIAKSYCDFRAEEFQRLSQPGTDSKESLTSRRTEIVSPAAPQMRPVRPNRYLAAVTLGCGVFLMMGGIICLNNSGAEDPENRD